MKNLDINSANRDFGDYSSRRILIEFTGGNFTERLQGSTNHTVIVPYSSFSKRLQTIQRHGSKIINVSIYHHPEVFNDNPEHVSLEQIDAPILEVDHEIQPQTSIQQPIAETLEIAVVEVAEITAEIFPKSTPETIAEIAPEVSEVNPENISEAPPKVVTPKKKKAVSESTAPAKPKKAKASPKASPEVNQQELNTKVQEPIAEPITVSEPVLEPEPEIVVETISAVVPEISLQPIAEEVLPDLPKTEVEEPIAPLAKAKSPRSSSKSGHGFNKPKSDTKPPKSPKQPKS